MPEGYAIQVEGLTKFYGSFQALFGVDLAIREGEIYGFLGPNGSGKTTTIRCLLDLISPASGLLRVGGLDPQKNSKAVRQMTGYLPGELHLDERMNVKSLVKFLSQLRKNPASFTYACQLAEELELPLDTKIKNLSKGNKQKVGIVQALMHHPRILMLDEPTGGLDPMMRQLVLKIISEAQDEGTTVFFSSHVISEVEQIADRVGIIRKGKIASEITTDELFHLNLRRVVVRFDSPVRLDRLSGIENAEHLSENATSTRHTFNLTGSMRDFINRMAELPVRELDTERPSLEDVFMRLYEDDENGRD